MLTLELGEAGEPVTLEVAQGQSLQELNVNAPQRDGAEFAGWYTEDETAVDPAQPLRLTQDTVLHAVWTKTEEPEVDAAAQTALGDDREAPLTRVQAVQLVYRLAKQAGLAEQEAQSEAPELPEAILALEEAAQQAFAWALDAGLVSEAACEQPEEELTQKEIQALLAALWQMQEDD